MLKFDAFKGRLSNIHLNGDLPDIFVFATPRSGSTFLLEFLHAQAGMKTYNEPLNIHKAAMRKALGVETWQDATALLDRKEKYLNYFNDLKENKIPELNPPVYRRRGRFITRRIVYKIIHGGEDLVPWFEESLSALAIILMRHPIPTALSHAHFPRLPYFLDQPDLKDLLSADQIRFTQYIINEGTLFEQGIVDWCLQNYAVLTSHFDPNRLLLSYEELTLFPREIISILTPKLQLKPVKDLENLINRPSGSTADSSKETQAFFKTTKDDRNFLIEKWKKNISSDQEQRCFEIMNVFNIDCYESDSFLPKRKYRLITEKSS